jgi:hypothetical protein
VAREEDERARHDALDDDRRAERVDEVLAVLVPLEAANNLASCGNGAGGREERRRKGGRERGR